MATHPPDDDDPSRSDPGATEGPLAVDAAEFDRVYRETAGLVLRSLRRLLPADCVDDAFQDTFLVVARRLADFEGRSKRSTWVYGITLRVAKDHRRSRARARRRTDALAAEPEPESVASPERHFERTEAMRTLGRILDAMDDDQRDVFVLVELERLPGPEAAEVLGLNVNTLHGRLRAARASFEALVRRERQANP